MHGALEHGRRASVTVTYVPSRLRAAHPPPASSATPPPRSGAHAERAAGSARGGAHGWRPTRRRRRRPGTRRRGARRRRAARRSRPRGRRSALQEPGRPLPRAAWSARGDPSPLAESASTAPTTARACCTLSFVDSRTDSPNNPAVLLQSGSETLSSSLQRRRPLSRHKQGDRELEISCCTAPCHPGTRDGRGELPRPGLWGPNDEGVWRVRPRGRATPSARQVRFGLASLVEVWVEAGDICVRAKLCLTCIRLYFHHVNFGNSGFGSDCQRRKVRYFYREECPHSTPLTRNKLWRPSCCADAVQPDQVG